MVYGCVPVSQAFALYTINAIPVIIVHLHSSLFLIYVIADFEIEKLSVIALTKHFICNSFTCMYVLKNVKVVKLTCSSRNAIFCDFLLVVIYNI